MPDTMAEAPYSPYFVKWKRKDGDQRLPKEILESSAFQALCDRFGRNPSDLSNAGLVTAFQALTLLWGCPESLADQTWSGMPACVLKGAAWMFAVFAFWGKL